MRVLELPRAVPLAAILVALAAVLIGIGCFCVGPPRMHSCRDPVMPTEVRNVDLVFGTEPIGDGDPPPIVEGPQGGRHWEFAIVAEGSGFGPCVAQHSWLLTPTGTVLYENAANVRAEVEEGRVRTDDILFFPSEFPSDEVLLRVEVFGRRLERRLRFGAQRDAGPRTDGGEGLDVNQPDSGG
jgi:hypothetical protein